MMGSFLAPTVPADAAELDVINQALEMIDESLGTMRGRELVSTSEVTNLLLDMRSLLQVSVAVT